MTSAILKSKKKWIKIVEIVTLPCEQSVMESCLHRTPAFARFSGKPKMASRAVTRNSNHLSNVTADGLEVPRADTK